MVAYASGQLAKVLIGYAGFTKASRFDPHKSLAFWHYWRLSTVTFPNYNLNSLLERHANKNMQWWHTNVATSMSDQAQPGAVLSLEAYTWRTTRGLILACALWLTSFVMAVELRFVVQRAKKCPYGLAGQWEGGLPAAMDKKDIIYLFIRDMQCIKTGMRVYRYNHIYIYNILK